MEMAEFYIFMVFACVIAGLAIYGNWLHTPMPRSYFASGTTFRDVFGHDVMGYFPRNIEDTYRYWEEEVLACSPSPESDLQRLRYFHAQARGVYEEALRRAQELGMNERSKRTSENAQSEQANGSSRPTSKLQHPKGWRAVLGLPPDEADVTVVKKAFRKRVRTAFPDLGGSHDEASTIISAYKDAKAELGFV
jgi:hypothetical protein